MKATGSNPQLLVTTRSLPRAVLYLGSKLKMSRREVEAH